MNEFRVLLNSHKYDQGKTICSLPRTNLVKKKKKKETVERYAQL